MLSTKSFNEPKIKPRGFTEFARRHGEEHLLDRLERNEAAGVAYHRTGIMGDYDDLDGLEELIRFIETGERTHYAGSPRLDKPEGLERQAWTIRFNSLPSAFKRCKRGTTGMDERRVE